MHVLNTHTHIRRSKHCFFIQMSMWSEIHIHQSVSHCRHCHCHYYCNSYNVNTYTLHAECNAPSLKKKISASFWAGGKGKKTISIWIVNKWLDSFLFTSIFLAATAAVAVAAGIYLEEVVWQHRQNVHDTKYTPTIALTPLTWISSFVAKKVHCGILFYVWWVMSAMSMCNGRKSIF